MTVSDIWDNATSPDTEVEYGDGYSPPWESAASNYAPAVSDSGDGPRWMLPSVEKLAPPESMEASQEALQEMGRLVEETLADHGVRVEVSDVRAGPRVVQFGLSPGWVPKKGGDSDDGTGQRGRVKVQSI